MFDISQYAAPVFAFYLLVFCNYTKEILGCRLQSVLENSILAKHVIGICLLFALIVIVNPISNQNNVINITFATFGIYIWYMMTIRTPMPITLFIIAMLFVIYMINIEYNRRVAAKEDVFAEKLKRVQNIVAYCTFALTIIGFVIYTHEKMNEYGDGFNLVDFVFGKKKCRGYTPAKAKLAVLR